MAAIDTYLLRERIAAAGMDVVWRAKGHETPVTFVHDPDEIATLVDRLRDPAHPSAMVTIAEGPTLLVVEHLSGETLAHKLRAGEQFSVGRAVDVTVQILGGLAQAHAAGIVHADVRPEHVMIDGATVTLVDVGAPDEDDEMLGAPSYLAPEVMAGGPPTVGSDLYSVGVILYELLTGSVPFVGETLVEIMARQLRDTVPPPSVRARERAIPAGVELVTLRALSRTPNARFASAEAFASALTVAMRAAAPRPRRVTEPPPPPSEAQQAHLREAVTRAIQRGDCLDIVDRYLDLALALSRGGKHAAATATLDNAIDHLMKNRGIEPADLSRLVTRLRSSRLRLLERMAGNVRS